MRPFAVVSDTIAHHRKRREKGCYTLRADLPWRTNTMIEESKLAPAARWRNHSSQNLRRCCLPSKRYRIHIEPFHNGRTSVRSRDQVHGPTGLRRTTFVRRTAIAALGTTPASRILSAEFYAHRERLVVDGCPTTRIGAQSGSYSTSTPSAQSYRKLHRHSLLVR